MVQLPNPLPDKLIELERLIDAGMDPFLQAVVDYSRELVNARMAGLVLVSQEHPNTLSYFKVSGWRAPEQLPQGHGLFSMPMKTNRPLRIASVAGHPRSVGTPQGHPPIEALMSVPIHRQGRTLGCIFVAHAPGCGIFTQMDEERLAAFAQHVSALIEIAARFLTAKEKAVRQERQRLRRRLHDSVAQTLFVLGGEIDQLEKWMQRLPESEEGRNLLRRIQQLAGKGLAEIRATLFSMAEDLPPAKPAQQSFERMISQFEKTSRIRTELIIRGDLDSVPSPLLQCIAKVVGESLSNVYRHANSDVAIVTISVEQNYVVASVQDIGVGISDYALSNLYGPTSHFGLRSMKSMVEEMCGNLRVFRNDEGGTTIRAQLPLLWRIQYE